jgi:hypothetical protein
MPEGGSPADAVLHQLNLVEANGYDVDGIIVSADVFEYLVHRRGHTLAEGAYVSRHAGALHLAEHHGGVAGKPCRIESAIRSADLADSLVEVRLANRGRWLSGRRSRDRLGPAIGPRPSTQPEPHGGEDGHGLEEEEALGPGPDRFLPHRGEDQMAEKETSGKAGPRPDPVWPAGRPRRRWSRESDHCRRRRLRDDGRGSDRGRRQG